MNLTEPWDVIVIGGGHAGCEAAMAAAKQGCRTAMVTLNPSRIGFMSCNPAVGGLAKGQLVKEIDALGGVMGRVTDQASIQYRRLNESKGPAVRSSRSQCDKNIYSLRMQERISAQSSLTVIQGEVTDIQIRQGRVHSIQLKDGTRLKTKTVVITSGTFLQAVMHTGEEQTQGGRLGDQAALGLSGALSAMGFRLRRLKTGTPPRLHRRSIPFETLTPQYGDPEPIPFSFYYRSTKFPELPQLPCFITETNLEAHEIIQQNLLRSPIYSGAISGTGPRYCPSIEDKVKRFENRDHHQIFLEPEGLDVDEIYVNGISTSLPRDVQDQFVRRIRGLENAEFIRYGYAVEYDAVDARQLKATLESKDVGGLYFAGQVNGTSGYEEAAGQGIVAGINAAQQSLGLESWILGRDEAYIGVMIDDLILKGSDEPYRMFTSRAEYRLHLREDNADLRLSEKGYKLGLLSDAEYALFSEKRSAIEKWKSEIASFFILPSESNQSWFLSHGHPELRDRISGNVFLRRPGVSWTDLCELGLDGECVPNDVQEQIEIQIKYEGYIERDLELMRGIQKHERLKIPTQLDYESVPGLSNEIKGRLWVSRPETIGQMARMQGITPAAVANMMIFLKMKSQKAKTAQYD